MGRGPLALGWGGRVIGVGGHLALGRLLMAMGGPEAYLCQWDSLCHWFSCHQCFSCHWGTRTPLTFRISQTGSTKPCHPAVYHCISTVYLLPQSIDWTVWTVSTVYPYLHIQSFAFENLFRMQSESRIQSIQSIQPNDTRARGISQTGSANFVSPARARRRSQPAGRARAASPAGTGRCQQHRDCQA